MGTLALAADERVADVTVTEDELTVQLMDGRAISVPVAWYPRLLNANEAQRKNWRISGGGYGIHWPDIDEDLSAEGLLRGVPAGHGQTNLSVSSIQDTVEDYQKGLLDYMVEVENAQNELTSIISEIGNNLITATGKLQKRVADMDSVKSSPAGARPSDVNTVVLLMAADITDLSKSIEGAAQRFDVNTNILEESLLASISLVQPEDSTNIKGLGVLKDSLSPLLEEVRLMKGYIAQVKDTIQVFSGQRISYAMTKAMDRQAKALSGLMACIEGFESFALRIIFQIDEKLSNP